MKEFSFIAILMLFCHKSLPASEFDGKHKIIDLTPTWNKRRNCVKIEDNNKDILIFKLSKP